TKLAGGSTQSVRAGNRLENSAAKSLRMADGHGGINVANVGRENLQRESCPRWTRPSLPSRFMLLTSRRVRLRSSHFRSCAARRGYRIAWLFAAIAHGRFWHGREVPRRTGNVG